MSRYLGPRLRIVRRLGYLVGLTRKKPSTRLLNPDARRGIRKVLPPGQHGRSKSFKKKPYESNEYDFLIRLKLKQRIRYHYGITEKQLVNYVRQARKIKGSTGRVLLRLLEMRLDNTVFRLHMAPTIRAARQLITHGHIYVNNKKVSIPSYSCKPKDIITPAPKTRSIQLLNNFLTDLDLEKSRFKNLLKILKFGKKGLLNNPKLFNNNKDINNQKNCKPNTIISLRIQRAGALEGQGIGFLGRNLVIVQPLFGNIKNYLGKSINICIYLKKENKFYGYPTKPFNIKMRYSKLINSIDAIQYFGRKKIQQNNDIKGTKNFNKSSAAILLMGGANILRNKLNKNNQNFRQNSSDNILVRIEAASYGKNAKSFLNRKRQLSPFLLNKTRDTNPILFREKYLYSRKNRRFIGINHIFYVKMILKPVEQNPTNINNLANLQQKQQIETKNFISIDNSFKHIQLYESSKLNKINLNNSKREDDIINTDLIFSKKNYNSLLLDQIGSENSLKLRKYYLYKLKTYNLFIEKKLSFVSWCLRKDKFEINGAKSKFQILKSSANVNKKNLKQKILKNLLSQTVIQKNLNINYFWKAVYLFSKIHFKQVDFSKQGTSFKKQFLQQFCEMILGQQRDFFNKNNIFSTKTFLFFSKTFSLISEWKEKTLINNKFFQNFINDIKESMSLLILLQKSLILLLKNQKLYSSFNIQSNSIIEYYKDQEFKILKHFQTKITNQINLQKFEKLSFNNITRINQFCKILELNNIKTELHFYQLLICNKKILNSNMPCKIEIFKNFNNYLNNQRFIKNFSIYQNSFNNRQNLLKKQLFKLRFELQIFINFLKKTKIFTYLSDYSKLYLFKETENIIKENLLKKQILQKLNHRKIQFYFKRFILINFLNKLKNLNFISNDQNQQMLVQIDYYLSQENYKKYTNILSKLIKNKELFNQYNYQFLLNKIKNFIFNEKTFEKLFGQQLNYIKKLQEISNFCLIINFNKNEIINLTENKVNILSKLITFEKNLLVTKTISKNLKKKIINDHFINTKKTIYLTKLNYFENSNKNLPSFSFQTILSKIKQQIIKQQIKQKTAFLSILKKYENHFIKMIPIFNMDNNGKYLTNYISQLFNIKEMQIFKKLDETHISFYPTQLNKKIIKQKIIQMTTSWSNYIVIFNKIRALYQDNNITKNEYDILRNQTKQFIIKQLILNKNKVLLGYNNYLKLGKNNITNFIKKIKNNVNNGRHSDYEFFKFSFIQMDQKYYQLLYLLINKEKLFLNQSIKNNRYFNRLRKINIFDPHTLYKSNDSSFHKNKQNYKNIYNNIFKFNSIKHKKYYQKFSSNVIMKLSMNILKWVDNISIMKLKKGINCLQKQQLITKPNSKLLISILLKLKQNTNQLTNNALSLESALFLKVNNIYRQKRIQSFINLLIRLNLSINYIKLNNKVHYPININVQNKINKKLYFQQYNQNQSNQRITEIIEKFTLYFNNKLQILTDLKIFDLSKKIQFQTLIAKMTNEILQINDLNKSMDATYYKTTKFVNRTIKLINLFIYYHLKYFKKINKQYLLNDEIQQDFKEKPYLKNDLLTKLLSKLSILKQQNLLTIPKYQKLLNKLKEQPLTKKLIFNLSNEINLSKLEQLIEYQFIHSSYIFYSKVQFFKFLTNFIILKERYELKQNKNQEFINKIRVQLNQKFQNEFQYIIYISKFDKLIENGILTNQQKDQIVNKLPHILNTMKNFSKRSIKLQERLKYGFINYRKYETITQNLIKNLQFKIQKLINIQLNVSFFSDKKKHIQLNVSKFNYNNMKKINVNTSIKKIDLLQEICLQKLQKLMYFVLNISKGEFSDKENSDCNYLLSNYFKKELQFTQILNILKQIDKNTKYLKDLKNKTKTKIISQTRKFYGTLTNQNIGKSYNQNKKKAVSLIQNRKTKHQKNLLQTFKFVLIKNFLFKIKNVIYDNFNQNCSILVKMSNTRLLLIENHYTPVERLNNSYNYMCLCALNSAESLAHVQLYETFDNSFKKLQVSLQLSRLNNFYSKKYAFKIYQNLTSHYYGDQKELPNLKLLSINPDFTLLNLKINNISKSLQKSYKYKILLNTQKKNDLILNLVRIQKLKYYGLLSVKNTKFKTNKQIQGLLNQLENILIISNYSNSVLISKYLKFEVNLLKKSEAMEELQKYLRKEISFISNKLNVFKNQSLMSSKKIYKQIKNVVLKTLLSQILIYPDLDSLKYLIKVNLISPKLYGKIKNIFYRKKFIAKLQNVLLKLKGNSLNNGYEFKAIYPKIILVLDKFNYLKLLNLISNNQYNLIQTQIQQILKYEQFISRLIILKKQEILTDVQYNQILLKIQQKIVQKVREQKIVQKFKQYIEYLYETKVATQSSTNKKEQQEYLNNKFKKIISLNQGRWALVAIKEFYQQNLLTTLQYNELLQKIEKTIRKKVQIAKLFSTNRYNFQWTISNKFIKSEYKRRQNQQTSKLLTSLPNIWTKNILKELRKQAIISNNTYSTIEKQIIDHDYLKTNENQTNDIITQSSKEILSKKVNNLNVQTKKDLKLLKISIESLLNYKKQIVYWLSTIETAEINYDHLFDLSYLTNLKINENISQTEYNKLKIANQLAINRLHRLKTLQKGQSLSNLQYEKIYQKIIKSYLIIQLQYIQRLLRKKQSILQELDSSSKNKKSIIDKTIKKHLNKIKTSKKLFKNTNSLYSLLQEVLSQLPISTANKTQSSYRQRIIYNRLFAKLRSDETLIKKWKQILTKILKKQLTPPLDIPPHLELKRIQISIIPTNIAKKNNKNLIIPIGTVINLPSRKTVGISVLERLIVEYYSRN
uniref:Small ribosomal subunit protein uS4c n=1 Tax=Oedogonium cardiacum TaxID=55995 RepID=B2X1Z7_OEDCA|nr:ribosomal protein S4 [Oedogonium cardiacum]ABU88210.1 ribosomal protein S4 [Oedogonium cardiacum]ACC97258.1 ribosomal protein S4 [Oedogonium cardiacum]